VPLRAEIIPFELEQVSTCVGTKMPIGKIFEKNTPFLIMNYKFLIMNDCVIANQVRNSGNS